MFKILRGRGKGFWSQVLGWVFTVVQFLSRSFCDPMDFSTPGFPILHYLPEFAQIHVFTRFFFFLDKTLYIFFWDLKNHSKNTHKIYHLNHLKLYRSVVLNISRMLCKHHHIQLHNSSCKTETLCPLNNNSLASHFPLPPVPGNYYSTFCLMILTMVKYITSVESYSICPFVTGLFLLA